MYVFRYIKCNRVKHLQLYRYVTMFFKILMLCVIIKRKSRGKPIIIAKTFIRINRSNTLGRMLQFPKES